MGAVHDRAAAEDVSDRASGRRIRLSGVAVSIAVLGFWLFAKQYLFTNLEYTSDLFTHLQMSRSVFRGQPFLADNQFGSHIGLHNYFLMPLFYPLTGPFGAYGLFLWSALLMLVAAATIATRAASAEPGRRDCYLVVLVAGLLGPISLWILDNPIYGWHVEPLYVPFGVMFALALLKHSRLAALWAALIFLTKEDGAVLAWAIHVLYEFLRPDAGPAGARWRRIVAISAAWVLAFAAGMAVLIATGAATSVRLGGVPAALKMLSADPETRSLLVLSFVDAAWLALGGAVLWLGGLSPAALLSCMVLAIVVVIPQALGTILYTGVALRAHGLAWPARFALLWSLWIAATLFAIARPRLPFNLAPGIRRTLLVVVAALSIAVQAVALRTRRNYDVGARLTPQWPHRPPLAASALSTEEKRFLQCLALHLPRSSPVASDGSLFAFFHWHDVVWPDRAFRAWRKADLVVCDAIGERLPFRFGCLDYQRSLPADYASAAHEKLLVRYLPLAQEALSSCGDAGARVGSGR
jgi:hypothetical protein